jgi:cytochrome P450
VLASRRFAASPFEYYEAWRANGDAVRVPRENVWVILGYDAAAAALKDTGTFSSSPGRSLSPALHGADGNTHAKMRRLLQPLFSAERQHSQRPVVRRIVAEALEHAIAARRFDAARDFADRVAMRVACEWLGLSEAEATRIAAMEVGAVSPEDVERASVQGGVIDQLASSGTLSDSALAELAGFFLLAGVKTAKQLVLFGMMEIARQNFRHLEDDPALLTRELLRLEPPVHAVIRRTTAHSTIDGEEIPPGATVWISLAAANRDPSRFDRANDLLTQREGPRHLSFAAGPHVCPGSHLGQIEAEEMLIALIPHMRGLMRSASRPSIVFSGPDGAPALREITSWRMSFGHDD